MTKQWKIYEKRISVRLVANEKEFLKYTSRPTHITHKIFDKNFAAIHEIRPVLMINKSNLCWIHCSRIKQMVDV